MNQFASFRFSIACLAVCLVLAVCDAAFVTNQIATEQGRLDQVLSTGASEKAALVESELERVQAQALLTARIPPVSEVYADEGSHAAEIAAVADPRSEVDDHLSYLWELNQDRLVESGYVDLSGRENSRIVRGVITPTSELLQDVRSWPSFSVATSTQPGSASITAPFLSPSAGVPVVAVVTPIEVDGKIRAYIELELAMSALEKQLSTDLEPSEGIIIVDNSGRPIADVGSPLTLAGWLPSSTLMTLGSQRVAARPVSHDNIVGGPWYIVAAAPPPALLPVVFAPAQLMIFLLALIALLLAVTSARRARASAADDLAAEQGAREEAERLSRVDMLTGLFNRRHAMETIEHELARSARDGSAVGVIMFDIDYFKRINDAHGHGGGDAVLIEVARRLRSGVRQWDIVARVGGEEFCVIAPSMDSEAAVAELGDRLRQAIGERAFVVRDGKAIPVTISAGAAFVRFNDGSAEHALDQADRGLYAAKRRGRNRLSAFSSLDETDLRAEQPECLHLAEALARASELRETAAKDHGASTAEIAADIAQQMGLPDDEILRVRLGGWLHDVGKIGVPDHLVGATGVLSKAEQGLVHRHPVAGVELIAQFPELTMASSAVLHHHEWFDGTGYPDHLAGERIPLEARIVAVADAVCALTSDLPKAHRRSPEAALAELRRSAGARFDPVVLAALGDLLAHKTPTPRVAAA